MHTVVLVLIIVCILIITVPVFALWWLFRPGKRPPCRRDGSLRGENESPIRYVGGEPYLFDRLPYPYRFDRDPSRGIPLDGPWQMRLDPDDRGSREAWYRLPVPGGDDEGDAWIETDVPSTFNSALSDRTDFLGAYWYRRPFVAEAAPVGSYRRLCFEGVLIRGEVWINGDYLGRFEGGFSPVYFDITQYIVTGNNTIYVRADNRLVEDSLPPKLMKGHNPGWHTYAGIHRPVYIEEVGLVSVFKTDIRLDESAEGPRITASVFVWRHPDIRSERFPQFVSVTITPGASEVDRAGDESTYSFDCPFIGADEDADVALYRGEVPVPGIARWSPETPSLYRVECRIGEASISAVRYTTGFRTVAVDGGVRINGEQVFLRGICRHEDHPELGATQSDELIATDYELIAGMDANYVRMAHYAHDRKELEYAMEHGVLLSEEIPLYQVGMGFTAWFQERRPIREFPWRTFGTRQLFSRSLMSNARLQLIRMIESGRNNPAIIFRGVGNECYTLGRGAGSVFSWLASIARLFDPSRPVTNVEVTYGIPVLDSLKRGWIGQDICSVNAYYGWYYGNIADIEPYLQKTARRASGRPFLISEFGAGAMPGRTEADGPWKSERVHGRRTYSEEYQIALLRAYFDAGRSIPGILGFSPWIFADFYNIWFPGNPVPNYNVKGLCTRFREPKRSYAEVGEIYRNIAPESRDGTLLPG